MLTSIYPQADKQKWPLSTLWPSHLVMFEGGRRNLEQEEQLCLKKSGKISAPLVLPAQGESSRGGPRAGSSSFWRWGKRQASVGSRG